MSWLASSVLRLQPRTDILEAHDNVEAKAENIVERFCHRAERAVLVRSREVKLVFLSVCFTQVKSQ